MNISELYLHLPAPLRRIAARFIRRAPYTMRLTSGLDVCVATRCDWSIFTEIFIGKEYDDAIHAAIDEGKMRGRKEFRFLDLGANVGYFTLKLLHELKSRAPDCIPTGILVEASPATFRTLCERLKNVQSGLRLINGAVGRREGRVYIESSEDHAGASVLKDAGKNGHGSEVQYVDLSQHLEKMGEIDLLKCDIEGSEEEFCQNYGDAIQRCRVIAIELHPLLIDAEQVDKRLSGLGFEKYHTHARADINTITNFYIRMEPKTNRLFILGNTPAIA